MDVEHRQEEAGEKEHGYRSAEEIREAARDYQCKQILTYSPDFRCPFLKMAKHDISQGVDAAYNRDLKPK